MAVNISYYTGKDMKRTIHTSAILQPVPIVLICAEGEGRANITTIGDVAVMGLNPALIAVSLHEGHLSCRFIEERGRFSFNVPEAGLLDKVDYCGMVSGKEVDKSELFSLEMVDDTPTVTECPVSLILSVVNRTQVEQRVIYITEVLRTLVDERLLKDGKPDLSCLDAVYYGLDNLYYGRGPVIGRGYSEGASLAEKGNLKV